MNRKRPAIDRSIKADGWSLDACKSPAISDLPSRVIVVEYDLVGQLPGAGDASQVVGQLALDESRGGKHDFAGDDFEARVIPAASSLASAVARTLC